MVSDDSQDVTKPWSVRRGEGGNPQREVTENPENPKFVLRVEKADDQGGKAGRGSPSVSPGDFFRLVLKMRALQQDGSDSTTLGKVEKTVDLVLEGLVRHGIIKH